VFLAFGVLLAAFCISGIAAFGWLEFTEFTLHLPPLSVVIEGTLLSLGLAHRIRTLQEEKSDTLELLLEESTRAARLGISAQRFVPHEFLEFLGRTDISEVSVGDSMAAEMTVLFSDIRSFTTLSEGMTPKQNFEFVNEYLQAITPVIYEYGGFVDKFIGDAVMALFHENPDDACRCALKMQEALGEYNMTRRERGEAPLKAGIGIHTGSVMLGTVGDEKRLQTTVISDAVNLASRIEGLTKELGHSILISQGVVNSLGHPESLRMENLREVSVKGKTEKIRVYALTDVISPSKS
jgi:class 3 adenylate cyclase